MNPFTQGGWGSGSASTPSIFGALPSTSLTNSLPRSMQPDTVPFRFTSYNKTVLNCTVLGPQGHVLYRIVTDPGTTPSTTMWKDNESRTVALLNWQPHTIVEIRGAASRQRVRTWLMPSEDKSSRLMSVGGIQYAWTPIEEYICLYKPSAAPKVLARVSRGPNSALLEMTPEAMQLGLLEPCVVAAAMFVSGQNID